MRKFVVALAALATPVVSAAQSAPSTSAPSATAPSSMGRWDEYRQRQERGGKQQELHEGKTGSHSANLSNTERRLLGSEYAKCVAGKHPDLVREYVLSEKNSGKRDDRFAKLADWKCLPSNSSREITTLYLSGHGARYVFAEHLLQTEKLPVVDNFGAVAMLVHPEPLKIEDYKASGKLSKQAYAKRVDQSFGEFALSRIGECVVRADTLGSKRLLKTAIGSAEEVAAINTLLPVAGGCIKDGSIKMKPEQVRGTVALNLYRLTVASMQTEKKPDA